MVNREQNRKPPEGGILLARGKTHTHNDWPLECMRLIPPLQVGEKHSCQGKNLSPGSFRNSGPGVATAAHSMDCSRTSRTHLHRHPLKLHPQLIFLSLLHALRPFRLPSEPGQPSPLSGHLPPPRHRRETTPDICLATRSAPSPVPARPVNPGRKATGSCQRLPQLQSPSCPAPVPP